jgi:hypothetical protein
VDSFIAEFGASADADLMLCRHHGVAYQRDMSIRVPYDETYFNKCAGYEDQEIARKINSGRIDLVNYHVGNGAAVLDIGIGSGEFIRKRPNTFGYDINPKAEAWLRERGRWHDGFMLFRAFTFWDVIEHIETPDDYFMHMAPNSYLFTCLPIFEDLSRIRESKHYRPGEHLYYWTERGFIEWMKLHRFTVLARQAFESDAGRDSILSFAFHRAS